MADDQGANRREFLAQLATVAGATVLVPAVTACEPKAGEPAARGTTAGGAPRRAAADPLAVPSARPAGWDPMAFNLKRGEAGAIPAKYLADIKAPGGDKAHLGKHLPYIPKVAASLIPAGYLAVMWGDPAKGNAKHPNSPPDPAKNDIGHWYNWIKICKAVSGAGQELRNDYPHWPGKPDGSQKQYVVFGGGELTADQGKNTIYLVKLPDGLQTGDTLRIWAHCHHHGEYVDFLTV